MILLLVGGCAYHPQRQEAELPPLRVEQVSRPEPAVVAPVVIEQRPEETVSLTAMDADLRVLLPALAEAAGVSLIVPRDLRGTVSLHLEDVPAMEALERVLAAADLSLIEPLAPPWPRARFYVVPVNVNEADAATIMARFDVSAALARFIVRSRVP